MSDEADVEAPEVEPVSRIAAGVGAAIGVTLMAVGFVGAFADGDRTHPFKLARWVVAADLAHDLVLVPIVAAVSWLIGRWIPPVARVPFRWATATVGVVALISWPFVRGYGRNATVPSLLPRNYALGVLAYAAGVLVVTCAWTLVRSRRGAPG